MIVSLTGRLVEVRDGAVVLDVHGVGYEVIVTSSVLKPFRHWGRNCMFKPTCRCGTMLLSSMALLQLKRGNSFTK